MRDLRSIIYVKHVYCAIRVRTAFRRCDWFGVLPAFATRASKRRASDDLAMYFDL